MRERSQYSFIMISLFCFQKQEGELRKYEDELMMKEKKEKQKASRRARDISVKLKDKKEVSSLAVFYFKENLKSWHLFSNKKKISRSLQRRNN